MENSIESDSNDESEKSSLAGELLGSDNWPLFIQFSVAVYVNGQMDSYSIEFIPNCLRDIFEKCAPSIFTSESDTSLFFKAMQIKRFKKLKFFHCDANKSFFKQQ